MYLPWLHLNLIVSMKNQTNALDINQFHAVSDCNQQVNIHIILNLDCKDSWNCLLISLQTTFSDVCNNASCKSYIPPLILISDTRLSHYVQIIWKFSFNETFVRKIFTLWRSYSKDNVFEAIMCIKGNLSHLFYFTHWCGLCSCFSHFFDLLIVYSYNLQRKPRIQEW